MSWPTAFLWAVIAVSVASCVIIHPRSDRCDVRAICPAERQTLVPGGQTK